MLYLSKFYMTCWISQGFLLSSLGSFGPAVLIRYLSQFDAIFDDEIVDIMDLG